MRRKHTSNPRTAFLQARSTAERRGVPWRFTFDEWWAVWEPHWPRRANEALAMCRKGDAGAYEKGNVRIDTQDANMAEYRAGCAKRNTRAENAQLVEPSFDEIMARLASRLIRRAIHKHGTKTAAAKSLGMTYRSFRYQAQKIGLTCP